MNETHDGNDALTDPVKSFRIPGTSFNDRYTLRAKFIFNEVRLPVIYFIV